MFKTTPINKPAPERNNHESYSFKDGQESVIQLGIQHCGTNKIFMREGNRMIIKMGGGNYWSSRMSNYALPSYEIGFFESLGEREGHNGVKIFKFNFTKFYEVEYDRKSQKDAKNEAIRLFESLKGSQEDAFKVLEEENKKRRDAEDEKKLERERKKLAYFEEERAKLSPQMIGKLILPDETGSFKGKVDDFRKYLVLTGNGIWDIKQARVYNHGISFGHAGEEDVIAVYEFEIFKSADLSHFNGVGLI